MSGVESLKDLDSNSSSWIFVDEGPIDNQTEKNKYYLNCDSEPIQELISQSSHPSNLEPETDSDGISIISESDDTKENTSDYEFPITDIKAVSIYKPNELVEVVKNKEEIYFSKYVIIGWIVVAVISPLLLNYFSTYMEEILEQSQEISVDRLKSKIIRISREIDTSIKELQDGITKAPIVPVSSKSSTERTRKYDSKGEADEHRLNYKEHFCPSAEMNTKRKSAESGKINNNNNKNSKKSTKSNSEEMKLEKKGDIRKKQDDLKEDDHKKKKQKTENLKPQKKKKVKTIDPSGQYTEEIKKLKKLLEKKEKTIKELTKLVKIKDKHSKMLEHKVLKQLNALDRRDPNRNNKISIEQKVNNTSGDWYYKMHRARADFRSKRQNVKDNWYWNWMSDREHLRSKRAFWRYTY